MTLLGDIALLILSLLLAALANWPYVLGAVVVAVLIWWWKR